MNKNLNQDTAYVYKPDDSLTNDVTINQPANFEKKRNIEIAIASILLLVSIAVLTIHFLFFRHSFPPINTDEASFFSPAKSFAEKGMLASDVHKSFLPGADVYTYWMPPLYIALLGGILKIFGSTIMVAKMLSLLFTFASALLLVSLAQNRYTKILGAALFLICPFIIITSAFIRVEAMAIFLTALALLAVKKEWADWVLGTIAALGVMTHPLMLACAAGLGLTSLRRGLRPLTFFALGFAVTITPYIWYIVQDAALFKEQMTLQFLRKAKAKFLDLKPMYLLQAVPMVLLALFCLYKTKKQPAFRLFICVSMLLALAIVLKSNEFNYQVYLVPYVIAAILLATAERRENFLFRWAVPALLFGFFSVMLFSKLMKYKYRTDKDFNELVTQLNAAPNWKGKNIFVDGGPDMATHLLMYNQDVEREVPVPQPKAADWFDKYNHVIEVRENGGENVYEEEGKPKPLAGMESRCLYHRGQCLHHDAIQPALTPVNTMKFYTLIHICGREQSMHNNSFAMDFEAQIRLYLNCAKQLHRSLSAEGLELIVLTNDKQLLHKLNEDAYDINIVQLEFELAVPSGIKFYSAHFKLEVFSYLASLHEDYIALVDSDMLCVNKMPEAFKNLISQKLPLYYDITEQVVPAYGAHVIQQDKEKISRQKSIGLWAGGEFLAGPPSFFARLSEEVNASKESYWQNLPSLHHQGDEVLTSVAIEKIKTHGDMPLLDAGTLSLVARYWSYVPLHVQKPIEGYFNHFLLHLPSDKKFITRLKPEELKGAAFFKKYKRHLSLSRTLETVLKNIKPYAKRIRKKLAF